MMSEQKLHALSITPLCREMQGSFAIGTESILVGPIIKQKRDHLIISLKNCTV
jgi:hypothetical protein